MVDNKKAGAWELNTGLTPAAFEEKDSSSWFVMSCLDLLYHGLPSFLFVVCYCCLYIQPPLFLPEESCSSQGRCDPLACEWNRRTFWPIISWLVFLLEFYLVFLCWSSPAFFSSARMPVTTFTPDTALPAGKVRITPIGMKPNGRPLTGLPLFEYKWEKFPVRDTQAAGGSGQSSFVQSLRGLTGR